MIGATKAAAQALSEQLTQKYIDTLFTRVTFGRKRPLRKKCTDHGAGGAAHDDADRTAWYAECATHCRARSDLFASFAATCQKG
jgi:hypothetical protein